MLDEGRKRDAAANAVLALSFAANAAQSPQALVSSGKDAAPGFANMQRLMDPRKKRKDLDLQRVSHSARNRKLKTFKEFVEEAYIIEAKGQPTFSSREDLERHYGGVPKGMVANNATSAENPKWRLVPAEKRKEQARRREERRKAVTGTQTPEEQRRTARKRELAKKRGKDLHHQTEIETSAKEFEGLSPKQIEAKKKADAKKGKYHGDDRRNLTLANPSGTSTDSPGFNHSRYHAFERRNRRKLRDIETAISPSRAFTTLVNKERREKKKKAEGHQ